MKTDRRLEKGVHEARKRGPRVTSDEIGVAVSNAAPRNGRVPFFAEKDGVQEAAWRVICLEGVTQELWVERFYPQRRTDSEIAQEAARALRSHVWTLAGIHATVEDGLVTLRGAVSWEFQRCAAEIDVRYLPGVVGLSNQITCTQDPPAVEEHALGRPGTTARTPGGQR